MHFELCRPIPFIFLLYFPYIFCILNKVRPPSCVRFSGICDHFVSVGD